ncbi:hypothetical protein [Chryseobacterium wanjuense]
MKLIELAKELNVSAEAIKQFIQDFDLELGVCISTNFEVKKDFEKFARENIEFLRLYEKDLDKTKTLEQIAETIKQPKEKVEKVIKESNPNIFDNGFFKSSISSYGIDNKLGGNYQFVYDYFGHKTSLQHRDFIGYRDLFFYISSVLEPFLNPQQIKDWESTNRQELFCTDLREAAKFSGLIKLRKLSDINSKKLKNIISELPL